MNIIQTIFDAIGLAAFILAIIALRRPKQTLPDFPLIGVTAKVDCDNESLRICVNNGLVNLGAQLTDSQTPELKIKVTKVSWKSYYDHARYAATYEIWRSDRLIGSGQVESYPGNDNSPGTAKDIIGNIRADLRREGYLLTAEQQLTEERQSREQLERQLAETLHIVEDDQSQQQKA